MCVCLFFVCVFFTSLIEPKKMVKGEAFIHKRDYMGFSYS